MFILIREAIGIGETLEIAKEEACRQLGVKSHEAEFEILQAPSKGTLGLFGKKEAKVKAFITISPMDNAINYIRDIVNAMGLEGIEISSNENNGVGEISLHGEQAWNLVGKRGETLNALQYLSCLIANKNKEDPYFKINLDIESYREKRERNLKKLAHRTAIDVLRTKKKRYLEPMNPYERKILHMEIETIDGVTSWSEGEDQSRHIVVALDKQSKPEHSSSKDESEAQLYGKLN